MITCDRFDLQAKIIDGQIKWRLVTDLVCGARAIASFDRHFRDHRGDVCVWVLSSDVLTIEPGIEGDFNGAEGFISVAEGDINARMRFDEIGANAAGMASPPSDGIRISIVVGGRQRLKSFGKNNGNLTGDAVHNSGGINIASAKLTITHPISADVSPI